MPDARVQAAIDNWGSRFITNGVDFNDPKFGGYYAAYSRYGAYYGEKADEAA